MNHQEWGSLFYKMSSKTKQGYQNLCQVQTFIKIFFFKDFTYFLLDREGEGEREKHQYARNTSVHWSVDYCTPPTGDLAHNPGMCPDWELNWQPFGLQASTKSTEPHQLGLHIIFIF